MQGTSAHSRGDQLPLCQTEKSGIRRERDPDLIICLEVVEHLFNPQLLVETARNVLKPGGHVIISTPYHGYLKNLALALFNKWDFHHHPERVGGHIKFWSSSTLRSLFEKDSFRAVQFRGAGRAPYLWNSMIWVFQKT